MAESVLTLSKTPITTIYSYSTSTVVLELYYSVVYGLNTNLTLTLPCPTLPPIRSMATIVHQMHSVIMISNVDNHFCH